MYNTGQESTVSGCVICCRIQFSCSVSIRQIQFTFRRFMRRPHQSRFERSGLLLGESGEHLFHGTSVESGLLAPDAGGRFYSKACGVQGAWVDSISYRILQPGSNVGVKLPASLFFHSKDFHYYGPRTGSFSRQPPACKCRFTLHC